MNPSFHLIQERVFAYVAHEGGLGREEVCLALFGEARPDGARVPPPVGRLGQAVPRVALNVVAKGDDPMEPAGPNTERSHF
jgi:hypothetical protein